MRYRLSLPRIIAGVVVGIETPVLTLSIFSDLSSSWRLDLEIGSSVAILVFIVIGLPIFLTLSRRGYLTVTRVIIISGFIATLPYLFIFITSGGRIFYGDGTAGNASEVLIHNGIYTLSGIIYAYIKIPVSLFLCGAFGGLLAWLIAIGIRAVPVDLDKNNVDK